MRIHGFILATLWSICIVAATFAALLMLASAGLAAASALAPGFQHEVQRIAAEQGVRVAASTNASLVLFGMVSVIAATISGIFIALLRFSKAVRRGDALRQEGVRALQRVAIVFGLLQIELIVARYLINDLLGRQDYWGPGVFEVVALLVLLVVSEVFKDAALLKDEAELTV